MKKREEKPIADHDGFWNGLSGDDQVAQTDKDEMQFPKLQEVARRIVSQTQRKSRRSIAK